MRLGPQEDSNEQEAVADLSVQAIQAKIQQHGAKFQETQKAIQTIQVQLGQAVDQAKFLQGAIKGLQDLLPKGEDIVKTNGPETDAVDVPQNDSAEPCDDTESSDGPEETPDKSE